MKCIVSGMFAVLSILFVSCSNRKEQTIILSEVKRDVTELVYNDAKELLERKGSLIEINSFDAASMSYNEFSDGLVDSVHFVQLSSDELIGNISRLEIFEDRIYVLDQNIAKKVFIFDMKGKLIKVIDDQGGGPNEYIRLGDMHINEYTKELIVADVAGKYMHYSLDGEFLRFTRAIPNIYYSPIENDCFYNSIAYEQTKNATNGCYALLLSKDSTITNTAFEFYPLQKYTVNVDPFNKNELGELLYIPSFCDTVYCLISNHSFQAKYVIRQAKSLWDYKDKELSEKERVDLLFNGYTCLGSKVLENNDFFQYSIGRKYKTRIVGYTYYYNKKNKKSFYFDQDKKFDKKKPLRKGAFSIVPPVCTYKDYFVGAFIPTPFTQDAHLANKEYLEIMNSADENTNPALVFYKLNTEYE